MKMLYIHAAEGGSLQIMSWLLKESRALTMEKASVYHLTN